MNLKTLLEFALNKNNFTKLDDYLEFPYRYLEFIQNNLQAVIVSQNENNYQFFQYKEDGTFNITRPINSNLMINIENLDKNIAMFKQVITDLKNTKLPLDIDGKFINNLIYTCQQSIGATLDALPANKNNFAKKLNGDLFERLMLIILKDIGINATSGIVSLPVIIRGKSAFEMKYQHDIIIKNNESTSAIGSVKTSSKDRIDKIFVDKFLYNRLTGKKTPHFAIFLNDVQRKGKEGKYGINATFLTGHFKGYTVKLNPLDGVYYVDIRPNMSKDKLLKKSISNFDRFLLEDVWNFD